MKKMSGPLRGGDFLTHTVYARSARSIYCAISTLSGRLLVPFRPNLLTRHSWSLGYTKWDTAVGGRGSASDSDVPLINTGNSNMSALASNTLHTHLKLL